MPQDLEGQTKSPIAITVNGDSMEVASGTTLTDLIRQLGLRPELVVVELNLNILKREELTKTMLNSGDQAEIVHFVGGGAKESKRRFIRGHFSLLFLASGFLFSAAGLSPAEVPAAAETRLQSSDLQSRIDEIVHAFHLERKQKDKPILWLL